MPSSRQGLPTEGTPSANGAGSAAIANGPGSAHSAGGPDTAALLTTWQARLDAQLNQPAPLPDPAKTGPTPDAAWPGAAWLGAAWPGAVWPGLRGELMASTTSTNQVLVDGLRAAGREAGAGGPAPLPELRVALEQTAGRGRLGRPWRSRPGASLTFSLAVPLRRAEVSGLSLAVGLAVAQGLDPQGQHLGLKWPNDVWCLDAPGQGRKLAGILIEGLMLGAQRWVVIGIGINILPLPAEDAAALPQPVACWQEWQPEANAPAALEAVLNALAALWPRFEADGFAALAEEFAQRDVLRGQRVRTNDAEAPEGVAEGVAPDGALRVRVAVGSGLGAGLRSGLGAGSEVRHIVSGEVSVRPAGMALPER